MLANVARVASSGCARGCSQFRTHRAVDDGALALAISAERRLGRGELPDAERLEEEHPLPMAAPWPPSLAAGATAAVTVWTASFAALGTAAGEALEGALRATPLA